MSIEVYSQAPSADEFRACLAKHIAHWQQRARQGRVQVRVSAERDPITEGTANALSAGIMPFLWVIAAGTPMTLITRLPMVPAANWPAGVYEFGGDVLRVGLIAARELPRDRTTLLIRLMAAGPLLSSAVPEVAQLPPAAPERAVAEPILLQFERMLGQQQTRTDDEQEFLMAMHHTWEDARTESRTETQAKAVLTVLRVRGIAVPDAARQLIQAERDLAQLERWHERAIVASSLAEVLGESTRAVLA